MAGTDKQVYRERTYVSDDGLTLSLRDYQPEAPSALARLPVICLPGLTRNARDFHPLALRLSKDTAAPRRVIALDYRGRGLSERDQNKSNYNVRMEAQDVLTACEHLGIAKAVFIGTSRGGLILHFLVEMKLDLLAAVILNDIGPELNARGLMRIRDDLNDAAVPRSWSDAPALLQSRLGPDFPALAETDWAEMAEAIYREIDGKLAGDFDRAIAEQLKTIDFEKPLPDLWRHFDMFADTPLVVIRGENSDLLSAAIVAEMAAHHPGLTVVLAPGQGHPPLIHINPVFGRIRQFLAAI
ncbi:alpha/beta hydrolase [Rhizobium sp. Root1220]|uniref:alpha/beta fold hydrolase n=1 Tax=Rhizobium sp. Root1220 TaxID=1736432 RepID=UPI0006FCED05|nr:alpha/beta hydrolase [Rhizobium sp. Root1220]KQV63892.1 hydrolase [Rhizobium sp. Root1220]